jgi:hypothetical protein
VFVGLSAVGGWCDDRKATVDGNFIDSERDDASIMATKVNAFDRWNDGMTPTVDVSV